MRRAGAPAASCGFGVDRVLGLRQRCGDKPDTLRLEAGDREPGAVARDPHRPGQRITRRGEGNDLDRGEHRLCSDRIEGGQGSERDRLVHRVDRIDGRGIETQHAGRFRVEIAAPVKGAETVTPSRARASASAAAASSSVTSPGSSRAAITSAIPAAVRAAMSAADRTRPFLNDHAARGDTMRQDRTPRLANGQTPEPHAAAPAQASDDLRMMETAISGGVTASISSPTGPWIRARAAASKPFASSRASRAACVFRDPSAPT